MRLGVESRSEAGCVDATVEHRGHRTFALGARNMHGENPATRMADQFERDVHAFELVDLAARLQRIKPVNGFGQLVHFQPGVYRLTAVRGRFWPPREPCVINTGRRSVRRDSSLQQLSLRMTRLAAYFFCVILSAAKDLARQRACLQHQHPVMRSSPEGKRPIPTSPTLG